MLVHTSQWNGLILCHLPSVDEDFGSLFVFFSLTPTNPRQCFNINITDDAVLEIPEDFIGSLTIQDPPPPAVTFGLLNTTVVIFDNDG